MARLRYMAAARTDLVPITTYIADQSGSRAVAERFANRLGAKCREIANAPHSAGTGSPKFASRYSQSDIWELCVIFFRYLDDLVEITNVIEGHRDIEALFRKNEQYELPR